MPNDLQVLASILSLATPGVMYRESKLFFPRADSDLMTSQAASDITGWVKHQSIVQRTDSELSSLLVP